MSQITSCMDSRRTLRAGTPHARCVMASFPLCIYIAPNAIVNLVFVHESTKQIVYNSATMHQLQ